MTGQHHASRTRYLSWSDDRYESAAIRFLRAQTRMGETLAEPNWTFELSRRWRLNWSLIDRSGLHLFVGAGAAYKTETERWCVGVLIQWS
jgi:hypothetical protein